MINPKRVSGTVRIVSPCISPVDPFMPKGVRVYLKQPQSTEVRREVCRSMAKANTTVAVWQFTELGIRTQILRDLNIAASARPVLCLPKGGAGCTSY